MMKEIILICPECGRVIDGMDIRSYPAYHGRENYICPFCDYHGDSVTFETQYPSHPYHNMVNIKELEKNKETILKIILGGAILLLGSLALKRKI